MDVIKKYRITPPLSEPAKNPVKDKNDASDDGKEKSIEVCGPMEMKGILGSDKRKYVLDCTRLTPRDANWVGESSGGTGRWEGGWLSDRAKLHNLVPPTLDDDEWTVCILRPELVASYAEMKISEFLAHSSGKGGNNQGKACEEDKKEEPSADVKPSTTTGPSGEEKEWVSVPEGEKKDVADQSKNDDSALLLENVNRTLRFNGERYFHPFGIIVQCIFSHELIHICCSFFYSKVNVFLPFTRSMEGIDKSSHETLKQDEEEARRMARYLWDIVIPNLSKDIRSSSVSGLQIPADGRSLTELMHQRGINCRYLGRLAELARKEELEDNIALEKAAAAVASNAADKQSVTPPRFRMPICWLELLECEMVARAAKHVLDSYMIECLSAQPAQMIASFLSAVMSVGEESAGETELRTIKAHSGSNGIFDQDETNALTLCFGSDDEEEGGDTASSPFTGRGQIWSDIEGEVGRRYRYALLLYNTKTSAKKDGRENRALFMPLLRRICQRSGIRLVARKYEVGKKCVCVGGRGLTASYPIAPTDVLDVLPLMKHAASGELP
jgi:protein TIF31